VDAPAAPALLSRAGDGLLVVGERGAGDLGEPFAGSVASTVVVHAAGPVVVVRGDEPIDPDGPVVVGVDGSPASDAAIDFAVETADAAGCPLVAVHTWWDSFLGPDLEPLLYWGAIEADEHRVLAEQLAGRSATHPDLEVRTVVERSRPATVLLEQARGAQLLVVGSRGRGGFAGLLLGSVSRSLVNRAPCPVAVVPPPGGPRHRLPGSRVEVGQT
jgi:nucleotide-binding universal stress UspA family protein